MKLETLYKVFLGPKIRIRPFKTRTLPSSGEKYAIESMTNRLKLIASHRTRLSCSITNRHNKGLSHFYHLGYQFKSIGPTVEFNFHVSV